MPRAAPHLVDCIETESLVSCSNRTVAVEKAGQNKMVFITSKRKENVIITRECVWPNVQYCMAGLLDTD